MAFYGSNSSLSSLRLCLPLPLLAETGQAARSASMALATTFFHELLFSPRCLISFQAIYPVCAYINIRGASNIKHQISPNQRLLVSSGGGRSLRNTFVPVSAVGSGRDSSLTKDEKNRDLSLENVKTSIVSRDDEMINVRVQLPGKATQKVFDEALTILARDAPPVPGFRKSKGGKTSNIPSSILLQMLGKSRVTKFVLQEILSITVGEFVKKEKLKVNPEIRTTQSEAEMESAFTPGSAFGFNVMLQLEKSDSDEDSDQSETS